MKTKKIYLHIFLILQVNFCFSQNFQSSWECLFPTQNTAAGSVKADIGLIYSVWVNPQNTNIILAGSNTGGIFKTTDGGQNWAACDNGFPSVVGIDDIVGRPDNSEFLAPKNLHTAFVCCIFVQES